MRQAIALSHMSSHFTDDSWARPLPPARVRQLLGRRLSEREGVGALLTGFLAGLEQQADVLQPYDAPRLGTVLIDLLSAWFAQVLEAEDAPAPTAARTPLLLGSGSATGRRAPNPGNSRSRVIHVCAIPATVRPLGLGIGPEGRSYPA
jgi:hypothetical protein